MSSLLPSIPPVCSPASAWPWQDGQGHVGPCRIRSVSLQSQAAAPSPAIARRRSRDLRRCSASCPGCARDAARAASLGILGCSLPSFLTVRNQRPGEKTILSANYHNYSIMAILDEFLMKCALVSSGFHNFQVQPLHSSHLLHKDFPFSLQTGAAGAGEEDGPSHNFAGACQN